MHVISLSYVDIAVAAALVMALAVLSHRMALGVERELLIAALRTTVQLLLVGLVLKVLFANAGLAWVMVMALVMVAVAAREVWARQRHPFQGVWGVGLGGGAMFVSSFALTAFALLVAVQPRPWYAPQYAIPLLGMLLGNTMSAVALGLDRLNHSALERRGSIEARLALGHPWGQAIGAIRRDSIRVALVPTITAMAAAGIVSLPGMMTGQILAGTPPLEAVKYQILIMLLITVATGVGAIISIGLGSRRLFDERERLRLDRVRGGATQ